MNYDVSELQEIWRKGNGEMPPKLKRISDEAGEELILMSLKLSDSEIDSLRYNAGKSNQTVTEYISALVLMGLQPAKVL